MNNLKDKFVLITGASAGIGEACAKAFAAEGANLVLIARRDKRLSDLKVRFEESSSVKCFTTQLDIRNHNQVERFVHDLPEEFSQVDILINNAGLARGFSPLQDGDVSDWDEMIDTNIKGLLYMTRSIVPGMIERKRGHIINIGSIAGRQVYPKGVVYCSTKFAVRALTHGMMIDLVETPVRVSTVDPGLVNTEFASVRLRGDEANAATVYEGMTPLTADDIAEAVIFCASRPPHVNISEMVVLPADQASPYHVNRKQ